MPFFNFEDSIFSFLAFASVLPKSSRVSPLLLVIVHCISVFPRPNPFMLLSRTVAEVSGQISVGPVRENSGRFNLSLCLMRTVTDPVASGAKSFSALSSLTPFPFTNLKTDPFWTLLSSPRITSRTFALAEQIGPVRRHI